MQPIPCLDHAHSARGASDKKDGERNVTLSIKNSRLILHAREFAVKHRRNFRPISLTLHARELACDVNFRLLTIGAHPTRARARVRGVFPKWQHQQIYLRARP